jgi:hypothetical protein
MNDFRVKLDPVQPSGVVRDRGDRARFRAPQHAKAFRRRLNSVSMAHPNLLSATRIAEEYGVGVQVEYRLPVFPLGSLSDLASKELGHQLLPVTDSKYSRSRSEYRRVYGRAARLVNAGRTTGDNHSSTAAKLFRRCFARQHLGVDSEFANLACDEVGVLAAGVEYGDLGVGDVVGHVG